MTTAEQVRLYSGPAVLSYGFRPFFLAGAAWAASAMVLWVAMLSAAIELPTAFGPVEWHVHELVFGYVPAIVAGFLLTAVPNWTKRLPVTGLPLLSLFLIWVAGRLAVLGSLWIGPFAAALIDLAFLAALGAVIAREIVAAQNTRNLKVLVGVGLLFAGNATFHAEALFAAGQAFGMRIGIAATLLLILIVGGRVVPSFTRNWLVKQGAGRLPIAFNATDVAIILVSATALTLWIVLPEHDVTAGIALVAGALNVWRLVRWAGEQTLGEPLVLILHIAYAFVGLGFLLLALAIWRPDILSESGALHGWTTGAISLMTLAIMTRASLGHCGQPLTATLPTQAIYMSALIAVVARIIAALGIAPSSMLHVSAAAWVLAYAGFVAFYGPLLLRQQR